METGYENLGTHECGWRTISQVHEELVKISEDMIGEEVAIDVPYEDDWIFGRIIRIHDYQGGRNVRFQTLKQVVLEDDTGKLHSFYQEVITQLLFKEN